MQVMEQWNYQNGMEIMELVILWNKLYLYIIGTEGIMRIVGQFSTRQFGTKIIKRTIWHQDNKRGQFGTKIIKADNLAPGQFGTKHLILLN